MTEIDEIELIKKHYGDFTGLYDPAQAVAHVKTLLDELDIAMSHIDRGNDKAMEAWASVRLLRGQVVTLLRLCDAMERMEGYDPVHASVTVREIRATFAGFDRGGSAPIESAPAAEGSGT